MLANIANLTGTRAFDYSGDYLVVVDGVGDNTVNWINGGFDIDFDSGQIVAAGLEICTGGLACTDSSNGLWEVFFSGFMNQGILPENQFLSESTTNFQFGISSGYFVAGDAPDAGFVLSFSAQQFSGAPSPLTIENGTPDGFLEGAVLFTDTGPVTFAMTVAERQSLTHHGFAIFNLDDLENPEDSVFIGAASSGAGGSPIITNSYRDDARTNEYFDYHPLTSQWPDPEVRFLRRSAATIQPER